MSREKIRWMKKRIDQITSGFKGGGRPPPPPNQGFDPLQRKTRSEKTQFFWSKVSKKCLKTPFLACFLNQKFACAAQKTWSKWDLYSDLGELKNPIRSF